MPIGDRRQKTLYGLHAARGRPHRYTLWRWGIAVVSTTAVAALPLTRTMRFDLWGGNHYFLGEQVDTLAAAKAFAFPFLAVNIAIILASRFLGRWLCGFGCPVGNMARLSEWSRWRDRKSASRTAGFLLVLGSCALLSAISFSFWVDWRVFIEGSTVARIMAAGFLLGMTGGLLAIVRGLELRFCRDYCPSGIYFAVLGPSSVTGVEFVNAEDCTECKACETVCPVDLHPRELRDAPERPGRGFYPAGLTNLANCLRCGDCVDACEATTSRREVVTPLALGLMKPVEEDKEVTA